MPELHLYEYAVIRLVPKVERGEFINIGLLLFCKKQKQIFLRYDLQKDIIRCFLGDGYDLTEIAQQLETFSKIAQGNKSGGYIAQLDPPARFRWLASARSSVLQVSPIHPGMTISLEHTFEKLFAELIA